MASISKAVTDFIRAAFDFPRSVTQRRAFRKCGMLYYLRYGLGYRAKKRKGTYAFGDVWQRAVEAVLKGIATSPEEMHRFFWWDWAAFEDDPTLEWGSRTGWRFFLERSKMLAQVAFPELRRVIGPRILMDPPPGLLTEAHFDERFTYELVPGLKETVIPDYVGPALWQRPDGTWTEQPVRSVIDWKTSDREYETVGVELDEQLTDYQVGCERHYGTPIEQVGLCVFVYQALPKVQWILRPRRSKDITDQFFASALVDDQRIRRNEFPRNPNSCFFRGRCEMVSICYESQREKFAEELERPEQVRNEQKLDWLSLDAIED